MLKIGGKFGDYTVEALLGRGGMGEVYKIRAEEGGGTFAVKVMAPPDGEEAHEFRRRFAREAELAMELNHRNLIKVYDVGEDPETGLYYIIMEYVPGGSVAEKLKQEGRLSIDEALSITIKVASALAKAHKAGVVHRDIKPANIMLDADGRPKLADLGIAKLDDGRDTKLTSTGVVMGTPAYMAPEQMLDSHNVTPKADIYSLGMVLYEMLTGERPHGNSQVMELMAKVLKGEELKDVRTLRPEVPDKVALLVKKMCANKAEERPENMDEVVEAAMAERQRLRERGNKKAGIALAIRRWRFLQWRKLNKRTVAAILAIGLAGITVIAGVEIEKWHRRYVGKKNLVKSVYEYIDPIWQQAKAVQRAADVQQHRIQEQEEEWRKQEKNLKHRLRQVDRVKWTYCTDGAVAILTGTTTVAKKLRIPDSIDGKKVVRIASGAFKGNKDLEEVELPDSVRSIGMAAFAGCKNLHEVRLGSGMQTIGESAFSGCDALETINFPEELETIGDFAFKGCQELRKVEFGNSLKWIGESAFEGCRSIESLIIPGSVQMLNASVFEGCKGLTKVVMQKGVKVIKWRAFCRCTKLREATIPAGTLWVEEFAFALCGQLSRLKVRESRMCIEEKALVDCPIRVEFKVEEPCRFLGFKITERKWFEPLPDDQEVIFPERRSELTK